MAHKIVKLLSDDDGVEYSKDEQVWHLSIVVTGDPCTLCSGEFYGDGESACKFKEKIVEYGGITCKKCLREIEEIKSIKLSQTKLGGRNSSQA